MKHENSFKTRNRIAIFINNIQLVCEILLPRLANNDSHFGEEFVNKYFMKNINELNIIM